LSVQLSTWAGAGRLRELEHNGVITGYRAVLDLGLSNSPRVREFADGCLPTRSGCRQTERAR